MINEIKNNKSGKLKDILNNSLLVNNISSRKDYLVASGSAWLSLRPSTNGWGTIWLGPSTCRLASNYFFQFRLLSLCNFVWMWWTVFGSLFTYSIRDLQRANNDKLNHFSYTV